MNAHEEFEAYKKLRHTFDQKDETGFISTHPLGIDFETTERGLFLPAETDVVYKLFKDALASGFLDAQSPFVDAGSGDARVNHIAALLGVRTSIGIEYAPAIVEKSIKQTHEFEQAGILSPGRVTIIQGDFTDTNTYARHGIDVRDIGTFFNYVNSWRGLLDFIETHAAIGTKLILTDEQFNVSNRVIEAIDAHPSLVIKDTIKYVYDKKLDVAERLTDARIQELQKIDPTIDAQHMHLDASPEGRFTIVDMPYRVVTVYLCEKVKNI